MGSAANWPPWAWLQTPAPAPVTSVVSTGLRRRTATAADTTRPAVTARGLAPFPDVPATPTVRARIAATTPSTTPAVGRYHDRALVLLLTLGPYSGPPVGASTIVTSRLRLQEETAGGEVRPLGDDS